ncbi:serine hydrolase domain-containing protein [Macrococcus capreoli]|uniref:serine hydrolase domain-containing protein n=1 Tax=Macrococcus capreoli TaxID=2982690 RepID=UPI003EE57E2D
MKKIIAWVLVLIISLTLVPNVHATGFKVEDKDLSESIHQYIEKRKEATVSVAIGVFKSGKVVYEGYYGYIDVENKLRASKDSIYEWGSVSKVLTWVSVMQLEGAGKIDFDEDIKTYLPKDFAKKLHYKHKVTMKDLMNHQAGFQEVTYPIEYQDAKDIPPIDQLLLSSEPKQIYTPGTVTAYSNWSTSLAAYVVESIASEPFYDYVKKHIFNPLNMTKTAIKPDWSDNTFVQSHRKQSKAYSYIDGDQSSFGQSVVHIGLYPSGAAAGTLDDYLKFTAEFTNPNTKLFQKADTLDRMLQATSQYTGHDIGRNYHGLWSMDYGTHLLGHSGNTQGFSSSIWFDPVSRTGYAVMTNEVGETTYNYGLSELFFGKPKVDIQPDDAISGVYFNKRTIDAEFLRMIKYFAGILPISKTDNAGVEKLMIGDIQFTHLGQHVYRQDDGNGLAFNLYKKGNAPVLEGFTSDYEQFKMIELVSAIMLLFSMLVTLVCVVISIIMNIIRCIRRKHRTIFARRNNIALFASTFNSIGFFYIWMGMNTYNPTAVLFISIMFIVLSLGIIANAIFQFYNKIKHNNTWANVCCALCLCLSVVVVIFFELYKFWI